MNDELKCSGALGCEKQGYRRRGSAMQTAARIRRHTGIDLFSYRCAACGRWHLTRMRPQEYREKVAARKRHREEAA